MVCFFVRRLIQAYLGDALSEGDARHLHHHCEACASCHAALREAQATARLVASIPRHSLPDEEKEQLLARIRSRGQEQLGEQLLGTRVPPPLPRKPLAVRASEAWDAARHGMTVAGFRILRHRAALSTCAAVPVAAMLLILLHRGIPTTETVATLGADGVQPRAADTDVGPPGGMAAPGISPAPGRSRKHQLTLPGAPPALPDGPDRISSGGRPSRAPAETGRRPRSAATRDRRVRSVPGPGAAGGTAPGSPAGRRSAVDRVAPPAVVIAPPAPAAQAAAPQGAEAQGHAQQPTAVASPEKATPMEVARSARGAPLTRLQPESMGGGLLDQAAPGPGAAPAPPAGADMPSGSAPKVALGGASPDQQETPRTDSALAGPASRRVGGFGSPAGSGGAAFPSAPAPGGAETAASGAPRHAPPAKGRLAGRSVEELMRLLKGKPDEARAAAEELGRTKAKQAVAALAAALREHPDPDVKAAAARSLAAIGGDEALAALRAAAASNTPAREPARRALEAVNPAR